MRPVQIAVAASLLLLLAHAPAQAGFDLGLAANYAILVAPDTHNAHFTSDTFINGNVGISKNTNGTSPQVQGSGVTINGKLDFAGPINVNNTTVTGTTTANVSDVTTAYNGLVSLSSTLGAEAGTPLTLTGSPQTINASSGTLDANGNRVFTVSSGDFKVSDPLTINGTASQYVVINIASGQTVKFGDSITLTGGITSDHVLYNILGTGNEISGGAGINGLPVYGTILAVSRKFNMDNMVLEGRVFGGLAGQDFSLVSNFRIDQPTVGGPVPEPATLTLWSALGLIGAVAGWRRKRQAA